MTTQTTVRIIYFQELFKPITFCGMVSEVSNASRNHVWRSERAQQRWQHLLLPFSPLSRTQCAVGLYNLNKKCQEFCLFFWVNICYNIQNLSKKPSVIRASKVLKAKNHFLSNTLKNPKKGHLSVKKKTPILMKLKN